MWRPPVIDPSGYRYPVVVFLNAIGDSILALPALRALARLFPEQITLVCDDHPYRFIFGELPLRRIVCVRGRDVKSFRWEDVAAQLSECDLLVSLVTWHSPDLEGLLRHLQPSVSVGFTAPFDIVVPPDLKKHVADLMLDSARVLWRDLSLSALLGPPRFSAEAVRRVGQIRESLPVGSRLLAVHSETQPGKRWHVDNCVDVIRMFLDRHPDYWCHVVDTSADVVAACAHPRVLHSFLPLEVAQCLVGQADLFVGIDSCFLHVADFSEVPSVGLFGPTRPERWGFVRAPNRTLQTARRETSDISQAEVLAALEELIADRGRARQCD